ncbi:nucleotide exchange factor GrpE [Calidifontibacillus oryziterrae]|uniref:nucleotide exchange factor GrpE n=1 Tax=Calidifontibacillus oryziterrae TaxID=1191699 RepID=UPI000475E6CE|nr:nucleotide exchange factor GrpE [Calidifontibacillus oryziterrae]
MEIQQNEQAVEEEATFQNANETGNEEDATENGDHQNVSEEQLQIQQLQKELSEKQDRLLRLQADFENYRRRVRLDEEAQAKYRAQSLIENILPALDNFERALSLNTESQNEATAQLLKGMEMIYRQLIDALQTEGLELIEAIGKEFDPTVHQAVMQVEDENYGPNIVVDELQKGYKLKDRVIRPTMVKVNQ